MLFRIIRTIIPYLIGVFCGIYFFALPVLGYNLSYFPGDLGDGRLNLYFLEHAHKFFTFQISSFWDAPFMYPEKNVIAYSDNLLGSAPIYSFFRLSGFDTYGAYQLWVLSLMVLNYTSAFILLKKLFKNSFLAVLGAMIFAFSLALQSQMTHVQMFPRYAIPLTILFLVYFKDTLSPKYLFLTLLFLVYQVYCGIYLGFMLLIPVTFLFVLIFISKRKSITDLWQITKWRYQVLSSFFLNALFLVPLMIPYMERSRSASIPHFKSIIQALPTVESYFFSHRGSLIWDFLSETAKDYPSWWNHQIFPGGVATLAMLFCIVYFLIKVLKKDNSGLTMQQSNWKYLFLTYATTKIIYLRFGFITLYFLVYFLPGFSAIRALSRIINIELLFYAIATSFLFSFVIRKENWKSALLFLGALALIIADNYTKPEYIYKTSVAEAKARTAPLIKTMKQIPAGAVVSYEPENAIERPFKYHLDAMLAAQKYDLKVINAYTGNSPYAFSHFWHNINSINRNVWLAEHDLEEDSIYVITSKTELKVIPVNKIDFGVSPLNSKSTITKRDIEEKIKQIRNDSAWMKHIKDKAKEQNLTIDSMVRLDAEWILKTGKLQ